MRILCVNRQYFITGGPEKYWFALEKAIGDKHQLIPFVVDFARNRESEYVRYFVKAPGGRANIYYQDFQLSAVGKLKYLIDSIYNVEAERKLLSLLKEVRPDVVLFLNAHYFSSSIIRACKKMSVPIVWRLSDFSLICPSYLLSRKGEPCEECLERGLWRAMVRCCSGYQRSVIGAGVKVAALGLGRSLGLYDYVRYYVAPSRFTRERMIRGGFPSEKVVHIPTFVAIPVEAPASTGEPLRLLYAGRLSPEKGVETLFDALHHLGSLDFVLLVAGDASSTYATLLRERVPSKARERVVFLGQVDQPTLQRLYNESHAVVVPSICYENMPNVALEAMAHGKPVIASSLGSLPEIIEHSVTGLLFKPGDAKDLASTIMALVADTDAMRTMGARARDYVAVRHNEAMHINALLNILGSAAMHRT